MKNIFRKAELGMEELELGVQLQQRTQMIQRGVGMYLENDQLRKTIGGTLCSFLSQPLDTGCPGSGYNLVQGNIFQPRAIPEEKLRCQIKDNVREILLREIIFTYYGLQFLINIQNTL